MPTLNALTAPQLNRVIQLVKACTAGQTQVGQGLAEGPTGFVGAEAGGMETGAQLRSAIEELGPEARSELIAVARLGRDGMTANDFSELREEAAGMDSDEATEILARGSAGEELILGAERLSLKLN